MKNIRFMLWMLCGICAFTACSDDDNGVGNTPEIFIPHMAEIASETSVFGNSLVEGAEFYLQNTGGEQIKMIDLKYDLPKITFTIPETVPEGDYSLFLKQKNQEINLGNIKTIMKMTEVKRLKSVTIMGMLELSLEYNQHNQLKTAINYDLDEQNKMPLGTYNLSHSDNQVTISGDLSYTYNIANGRITNSSDENSIYNWNYDEEGYLTDLSNEGVPVFTCQYSQGHLIETSDISGMATFEYTDNQLTSNSNGIEVASWVISYGFLDTQDFVQLFAQLLNLNGNTSVHLPSGLNFMGQTSAFSYDWDEEHWVTEADLIDWGITITFKYEKVKIPNYLLK